METIYWNPEDDTSVAKARAEFDTRMTPDDAGQVGYVAFYSKTERWVDPKKPGTDPIDRPSGAIGEAMAAFDPDAGCVIFRPRAS